MWSGEERGETCTSSVRVRQDMTMRTQTSTSEAFRIEFWIKQDGVVRQVPNRCTVEHGLENGITNKKTVDDANSKSSDVETGGRTCRSSDV